MTRVLAGVIAVCLLLTTAPTRADAPPATDATLPPGFDPARHMRVREVRIGMKGHGLSVFRGTKIERFEVEVLSVLRNFNPGYDVILIACKGANLEHTGSIAGMSGSPIYLKDDQGRERMVGAFAYGWPLMKDPVGGVQPIEYMLGIGAGARATTRPAAAAGAGAVGVPQGRANWSLAAALNLPGAARADDAAPLGAAPADASAWAPRPRTDLGGRSAWPDPSRLRPLAVPLTTSGLSQRQVDLLGPLFAREGLVPLAGGATPAVRDEHVGLKLEPGSTLAIPLLTGDMEMSAVGTCTEVLGDRVLGFGHSFQNEGPISVPMGTGYIHTVIANLNTSFKLGALVREQGSILADSTVGVGGRTGQRAEMIPIEFRVVYADGSMDHTYRFRAALHPRFTPLLAGTALGAALSGKHELPQYHTVDYDMTLSFANGQTVRAQDTLVNTQLADLFQPLGGPMTAAADNPFERVLIKGVTATIRVSSEAREAQVLSVNVPKTKHKPGDTVRAFVTYRPFRGTEAILPLDFELPRDLDNGTYQLTVADWTGYVAEEQALTPFRFTADSTKEVFAVLQDVLSIKHSALYLRLHRKADGVAVGRTAMPHLPSSQRQVMLGAGLSNVTPFVSSTVKVVPTRYLMSGSAQFAITIDDDARVQTPGPAAAPKGGAPATPPPPAATPAAPATPKPGEPAKGDARPGTRPA